MSNLAFKRPGLTLPQAEAAWITQAYDAADVILEYGSGGSTVMAAEMYGKTIFSVESDPNWAAELTGYLVQAAVPSLPLVHYADVGPVGRWGRPVDDTGWRNYHHYPLGVWDLPEFVAPDVVLIDGRFRAACLMAVAFRTQKPVTVYFDDYVDRPRAYGQVEKFIQKVEVRGRMARFDVAPMPVPADRLSQIMQIFTIKF